MITSENPNRGNGKIRQKRNVPELPGYSPRSPFWLLFLLISCVWGLILLLCLGFKKRQHCGFTDDGESFSWNPTKMQPMSNFCKWKRRLIIKQEALLTFRLPSILFASRRRGAVIYSRRSLFCWRTTFGNNCAERTFLLRSFGPFSFAVKSGCTYIRRSSLGKSSVRTGKEKAPRYR